jgi:hypothetical protein
MTGDLEAVAQGVPELADKMLPAHAPPMDLQCRLCELEAENARLRLLVSELLVANQRLREDYKELRGHQTFALEARSAAAAG